VSNIIFENLEDIELGLLQIYPNGIQRVSLVNWLPNQYQPTGSIIIFSLHLGFTLPILLLSVPKAIFLDITWESALRDL
jgi:hypothetical protein